MRTVPGVEENCGKTLLSSCLGSHAGFQTPLSQQEQYSPNAFLEINAFPRGLHSWCQHSCAQSCPPRSSVWSCHPSPGCDSRMVCWLCHAGTLPFLGRNFMTIKPRATGTFQVSDSSPLFQCLTLSRRNLSLDCDFLTGKWIWWLHSQQSTNILILCSEKWLIPPVLSELVDKHAFIFCIPVCNQPRRNFWNLLFFLPTVFLVGTQRKWVMEFKCSSWKISAVTYSRYKDGLAASDTWYAQSLVGPWMVLILL